MVLKAGLRLHKLSFPSAPLTLSPLGTQVLVRKRLPLGAGAASPGCPHMASGGRGAFWLTLVSLQWVPTVAFAVTPGLPRC